MDNKRDYEGKVITCILPKGRSAPLAQELFDLGYTRVFFTFARGFDIHAKAEIKSGLPIAEEKEVLTVIAKDEHEGEALFNLLFERAHINRLGGGLMYMRKLREAAPYMLPLIEDAAE